MGYRSLARQACVPFLTARSLVGVDLGMWVRSLTQHGAAFGNLGEILNIKRLLGGHLDRVFEHHLREDIADAFLSELLGVVRFRVTAKDNALGENLNGEVPNAPVSAFKDVILQLLSQDEDLCRHEVDSLVSAGCAYESSNRFLEQNNSAQSG